MMRFLNVAVVAALLSIGAGLVQAVTIDFEAPTYATGQLDGQDLWAPWETTSTTESAVVTTTASGEYAGGQGLAQVTSNKQNSKAFDLFVNNTYSFDLQAASTGVACINGTSQLQLTPGTPKYGPLVGINAGLVYIRTIGGTDYTVTQGASGLYPGGYPLTTGDWYRFTVTYNPVVNDLYVSARDLTLGMDWTTGFENGVMTLANSYDPATYPTAQLLNTTTYSTPEARQAFIDGLTYTAVKFVTSTGTRIDNITGVLPPPPPSAWNLDGSGNWNTGNNWLSLSAPNGIDAQAILGSTITANRWIYSETPITVGSLTFDNLNKYELVGDSLTMQVSSGKAAIDVLQGTQKINLPLTIASATDITVAPGATLKISDPLMVNAALTVTGNVVYESSVNVQAGGAMTAQSIVAPTLSIGSPPAGDMQAVPEPGSLTLLALAMLGALAYVGRKW